MPPAHIPLTLRRLVIERAADRCEYCLFPQTFSMLSFEIEHIVAGKHGGPTTEDNLAWACPYCNRFKGTDLGSLDPETDQLIPFFNPRTQRWDEHFRLDGGLIVPLTPHGRVTTTILQFNHPDRVQERRRLMRIGQYPGRL